MRANSGSLFRHWAMGVCLLLLWATTPAWSRFISKRETPEVDIGVNAFTVNPDIVMMSSESVSRSEVTTTTELERKMELQLTATTTEDAQSKLLINQSNNFTDNVQVVKEAEKLKQDSASNGNESKPTELQDQQIIQNITSVLNAETVEQSKPKENHNIKLELEGNVESQQQGTSKPVEKPIKTELNQEITAASNKTTTINSSSTAAPTTTTTSSSSTTSAPTTNASTQRSEDNARAMQFTSSTESAYAVSFVTPMKLRALPMTTTTTHTPQLLAALLHAGVTVTPSASHENAIEEDQLQPQSEKRAKFNNDNSTNAQQLTLPNGAEVWSLAAMKMVPTTAKVMTTTSSQPGNGTELANDIEPQQEQQQQNQTQQHKEKNLLDWQQIMLMQTSQDNHTEPIMMSTTLDATEAATQPTTLRFDAKLIQGELEPAANSAVTARTTVQKTDVMLNQWEVETYAKSSTTASTLSTTVQKTDVKLNQWEVESYAKSATTASTPVNTTERLKTTTDRRQEDYVKATVDRQQEEYVNATTDRQQEDYVNATADRRQDDNVNATADKRQEDIANATADRRQDDYVNITAEPPLTEAWTTTTEALTVASKALEKDITAAATTEATAILTSAATVKPELNELAKLQLKADDAAATVAVITTTTTTTPETLTTAEPEFSTTTTGMPGALNATPNLNEMAMKATAHEHNENGDKANDVDSDDVINVSVSVSVSTTETTLQPTERQPITVSTRIAGELSTTTKTTTTTPTQTPQTLHAKVDEQLETTTTTLPTPTEIVQISNEVNLETIKTVTNVTKDNNNKQTSGVNNLLITTTTTTTEANNNSATLQININSSTNITATTTTTTTPTSLLTDSKLNEHETALETNNIGETVATTTVRPLTIKTTTEVAAANVLDESTATTIATPTATAAKGASELYDDEDEQQQIDHDHDAEEQLLSKTNMANITTTTTEAATTTSSTAATTTTTALPTTTTTEEPLISLLDDSTTTTTTTTSTVIPPTTTTTAEPIYSSTTEYNNSNNMLPVAPSTTFNSANVDLTTTMIMPPQPTELDHMQQPHGNTGTDVNVIIAITVSVIGVVALILLVAFLYLMRKRQKQMSYSQRCRPVSLDAYSLDNVSVLGSVRRKGRDLRASKRTYGNAAFDDPSLRHNLLSATELGKFVERRSSIFEEFRDVPQIIARADEVPAGCEDKNRYANVIPLPETRVVMQRQGDDDKTEYINANYVRGPRDAPNYYIACQAPLESTTGDFWRMIWEQQSRVIVQATDLNENGIERCAEYLPPSVTLDNHSSYGDYQVTLKHREVKDKYAISTLMLKRVDGDECRELTHYWYKWPETGVPLEEAPIIAMLLEARSSLKSYALEQANELKEKSSTLTLKSLEPATEGGDTKQADEAGSTSSGASNEINGNVANKTVRSQQGPLTIHCSPGTGRTGTIIACDMAIRSLETPKRSVDIPQLVYYVRRGRASAVQTKEQYEFIYKVANMYATKITNLSNDN